MARFLTIVLMLLVRPITVSSAQLGGDKNRGTKATGNGTIAGIVWDTHGRRWSDVTLVFYDSSGNSVAVATSNAEGSYHLDLAPGRYTMKIRDAYIMAGNHAIYVVNDVPIFQGLVTPGDVNLNTFSIRLELMNKYYAAGQVDLAEAENLREQIHNASQQERVALQARLASEATEAMSEFQQALAETDENDAFFQRVSVLGKIAETDDTLGKYGDAVKIYAQAVALKPDAILYDNFAKDLARCGQVGAAINAYKKSAELASSDDADVYLNLGITLYNANRLDQAIAPLRRATELDPQNARPWYLLGTVLVGSAQRQQQNTTKGFQLLLGTIEAFQKAVELDPHGHYGELAQESMQELQRILRGSGHTQGPN